MTKKFLVSIGLFFLLARFNFRSNFLIFLLICYSTIPFWQFLQHFTDKLKEFARKRVDNCAREPGPGDLWRMEWNAKQTGGGVDFSFFLNSQH